MVGPDNAGDPCECAPVHVYVPNEPSDGTRCDATDTGDSDQTRPELTNTATKAIITGRGVPLPGIARVGTGTARWVLRRDRRASPITDSASRVRLGHARGAVRALESAPATTRTSWTGMAGPPGCRSSSTDSGSHAKHADRKAEIRSDAFKLSLGSPNACSSFYRRDQVR